jgi:hypothetical protein
MSSISVAFQELFYGSGAWLGLILLLALITVLSARIKYTGVLLLPVSIFLGIDYLNNDLMWHGIIMFFCAVFVVINLARPQED